MSAPVLKTPPAPRSSTTFTPSSAASSSRYAPSCSRIGGVVGVPALGVVERDPGDARASRHVPSARGCHSRASSSGIARPFELMLQKPLDIFQPASDTAPMDFRLDEEQLGLQDTVRRLCADRFAREDLARREDGRVDRDAWRALADLGVFSVVLPTSAGGPGFGAVGGAIVFEQLGAPPRRRSRPVDDARGVVRSTALPAASGSSAASSRPARRAIRFSSSTPPRSTRCSFCATMACSSARETTCPRSSRSRRSIRSRRSGAPTCCRAERA